VNLGNLTLLSVAVRDNTAGQSGGGIQSTIGTNTLTIDRSTISGNQASDGSGGGIDIGYMGSLTIANSTITNNSATIDGGGIYDGGTGGTTSITNTTISGNRANANSGGIHIFSTATITSSTITSNRADNDASGSGNGGGASVGAGGSLTLQRSMLAGNTDASAGAEAPDCSTGRFQPDRQSRELRLRSGADRQGEREPAPRRPCGQRRTHVDARAPHREPGNRQCDRHLRDDRPARDPPPPGHRLRHRSLRAIPVFWRGR
jgi:predicted outer membrane repeat protein